MLVIFAISPPRAKSPCHHCCRCQGYISFLLRVAQLFISQTLMRLLYSKRWAKNTCLQAVQQTPSNSYPLTVR
jgi:hypothetical protein